MPVLKKISLRGMLFLVILSLGLGACQPAPALPTATLPATAAPTALPTSAPLPVVTLPPVNTPLSGPAYKNPALPVAQRVEDLLARMSLPEKIGQMTQIETNSIRDPALVAQKFLGSVLSGGDGQPRPNTLDNWIKLVGGYQRAALQTRLGIPLIYGIDAVHGHNAVSGAVVYPHNIGLGAAGDPDLVQRIGRATAEEMAATGILWNFAPVLAVAQDIRWGRTYESYSQDTALVTKLGVAYIQGLQGADLTAPTAVLATPKHYLGDGGTAYGSSKTDNYLLDQGDVQVDEATLRALYLPPYRAAIQAGALSVMVSFSSWQGTKMHANKYLVTGVLKDELGFQGFVVSDWGGVDQISADYSQAVETAINAGIDMVMVPYDADKFINALTGAVQSGRVPQARIDDAVRRILGVKFKLGLFERPLPDTSLFDLVGSNAHRTLGREAVAKSLVLLKNDNATLPLAGAIPQILVAGQGADDIGIQCGGWTLSWQGRPGNITQGTTILQGIQAAAPASDVRYDRAGSFTGLSGLADVGIVVVGELPYAEGVGDRSTLLLSQDDDALVQKMRPLVKKLVVILISGRPLVVDKALHSADAFVAAWLPGTEGVGVADVLFGTAPFNGKLSFAWPGADGKILFEVGYGLK